MESLYSYWVEILEGKKIRAAELINESHALLLSVRLVLAVLDDNPIKVAEMQEVYKINRFQLKILDQEQAKLLAENLKLALDNLDLRILDFLPSAQRALYSASYFNNSAAGDKLSIVLASLIIELENSIEILNDLLKKK